MMCNKLMIALIQRDSCDMQQPMVALIRPGRCAAQAKHIVVVQNPDTLCRKCPKDEIIKWATAEFSRVVRRLS